MEADNVYDVLIKLCNECFYNCKYAVFVLVKYVNRLGVFIMPIYHYLGVYAVCESCISDWLDDSCLSELLNK